MCKLVNNLFLEINFLKPRILPNFFLRIEVKIFFCSMQYSNEDKDVRLFAFFACVILLGGGRGAGTAFILPLNTPIKEALVGFQNSNQKLPTLTKDLMNKGFKIVFNANVSHF